MKVSGFNEAVALAVEKYAQFRPEGYQFLRESLESTLKKRSKGKQPPPVSQHVTPTELLEGFRKLALKEFGPMAPTVLDYWGIHSCKDIGTMVFHLVEVGVFSRTEADHLEAFSQGFDFYEVFTAPFMPPQTPATAPPSEIQPSIFTT